MRDAQLIFSEAQAITANATDAASTNVVDLGALVDHKGASLNTWGPENGDIRLIITVDTKPTAGTGIKAELHDSADNSTFKPTGIGLDAAIPNATLKAGYEMLNVPLPKGLRRYLKVVYTTTGDHSASDGKVNAYLATGVTTQNQTPYRA